MPVQIGCPGWINLELDYGSKSTSGLPKVTPGNQTVAFEDDRAGMQRETMGASGQQGVEDSMWHNQALVLAYSRSGAAGADIPVLKQAEAEYAKQW